MKHGANINLFQINGTRIFILACQNGHVSTVQFLLNNGAGINLCIKDQVSPLIIAFENRIYEIVYILLNNGADTSLASEWEANPALVHCFNKPNWKAVHVTCVEASSGGVISSLLESWSPG